MANAPTLLTIPQTAKVMTRAYTTVREWVAKDQMPVPVTMINGHAFVVTAHIKDFLRIDDARVAELLAS